MNYVYSTLSCDNLYTLYSIPADKHALPVPTKAVLIRGGANVISNKTMVTPQGVVNRVSDDELAILQECPSFKEHVKLGFITIEKKEQPLEKVIKNMKQKDGSAQKTEDDFGKGKQIDGNINV